MDARRNPYAPGAGTPPPMLAGRADLIERADLALSRVKEGRPAKSFIAVGLRGVGKTVVLTKVQALADEQGYQSAFIEAHDDIQLPEAITRELRSLLLRLDRQAGAMEAVRRALGVLRSFASAFKVSVSGIDVGVVAEAGVGDSGNLFADLADLLVAVGRAAAARGTAVALMIDEIQYLSKHDLESLIMAIHRVNQRQLPVVLFAAGLPQVRGKMGEAKSYAERLFDFPDIGALGRDDARSAIAEPARREGVAFTPEALDEIFRLTEGYPYFLQEWGATVWRRAETSPVTRDVVTDASADTIKRLDESFFHVRLDRTTPAEKKYMRALAELGPGPHRSGDIARVYGALVTSVAPTRSNLIAKGMIYSPAHGDTAFTVPLFDEFMRRRVPRFDPAEDEMA